MEYTPEQEKQIAYIARYYDLILNLISPKIIEVAGPTDELAADLLLREFIPKYLAVTPSGVQQELGMEEKDLRGLEERCRKFLKMRKP